ncbi:alpha/beta fold hydrolase [Sphingomonas sp. NFR15]|uniref:alpha/beta fold hydrolase n=1 Tax=Sphingomonas sp. NFR15 TaxID=1566282 RepID=UPI00088B1FE6|nr:alpha/beta hydrolase [Sphingomonas sp. NFR15]SDA35372.1 Pimeloyl-ACP methyl ester carboxylesterase [Sphingomonas sp. NFR15]
MKTFLAGGLALAAALIAPTAQAQAPAKPIIVLVHGAFADSSSWNGVIPILRRDGYFVIAMENPLRGVRSDAAEITSVVSRLKGRVVLVGHSYGGSVISAAATGAANVKALVYVSAFAPDAGETALGLSGKFPGSTLAGALTPPVPLPGGGKNLYIVQGKFPAQFAADVDPARAYLMSVGQRPIAAGALTEPSPQPGWKRIPSYFVYGDRDRNIPPAALGFMAARAHARQTVVVKGASHVVMVSHPGEVAQVIERAAATR